MAFSKLELHIPEIGFGMAKNGCHLRNAMKNRNSVIVFAFHVGLDCYATLDYCQKEDIESRVLNIYRDWVSLRLVHFLQDLGYETFFPHGYINEKARIARLSFKSAAYEAGIGVYERPGILITSEYGPRVIFKAVLTNASIPPDKPLTRIMFCGYCYNHRPVGGISEKTFHLGRHQTLLDLNEQERERLLQLLK